MKWTLGAKSMIFFGLSLMFLILLTVFETSLAGLSLTTERIVSFLLLVIPAAIGIVFGILSITRGETPRWLGFLGVLLNAVFALFHLFLLSFAG